MATPTLKLTVGNKVSGMTSELNSLTSGNLALSSGVFSNVAGDGGMEGAPRFRLRYHQAALAAAPTANTACDGWFLNSADGVTYETGSGAIVYTPARMVDFSFPQIASGMAQNIETVVLAPISSHFKILFRNGTIGQTLASSANTLDIYPETETYPSV